MPKVSKIRAKGNGYTNGTAPKKAQSVFRCTRCGREHTKQRGLYPASYSPLFRENNGYVSICSVCLDELYEQYCGRMTSEADAMRRVCMICDLYWSPALFNTIMSGDFTGLSPVRTYISKLNITKYNGKTFDDTLDDEHLASVDMAAPEPAQPIVEEKPVKEKKQAATIPGEAPKPSAETILFWGTGFTPEIYQDLNLRYQTWTRNLQKPLELATEALYKQLCIQQVNVNQLAMAGKSVDGAQKSITDILTKLGLSPDQQVDEDEAALIENTPMGVWIRRWEDRRPLPEEDEDMKDRNGVIRYIHTWFFGHIGKMLGIKSPYTKMYEEEIDKYKIERPDLADVDDDDIINDEFGIDEADEELDEAVVPDDEV